MAMFPDRFAGKRALVTGAARGIGRAAAERILAEGGLVALFDCAADTLQSTQHELSGTHGTRSIAVTGDVRQDQDVLRVLETMVQAWGGLDILVNSAGVGRGGRLTEMPTEDWDDILDVNVKGIFRCCRLAFPELEKSQGCIVNLGSVAAQVAAPGMTVYSASKAAVTQFSRVLALEGARLGVRVNTVAPVWTETEMLRDYLKTLPSAERIRKELSARIPLGRMATPEDIATAITFLASPEASLITGAVLPVDGGLLCGLG